MSFTGRYHRIAAAMLVIAHCGSFASILGAEEPIALLAQPPALTDSMTEGSEVPGNGEPLIGEPAIPPAPETDQRQPPADDDIRQRLLNLEQQLSTLRGNFELGTLAPNKPRTTDMSPIIKTGKPSYPNAKLTGIIQVETAAFNQSGGSHDEFGTIDNGTGFRRARFGMIGDVSKNVNYMFEMDFAAAGRPSFFDTWIEVNDVPIFSNVRAGYFRQPFGMEELTSVRTLVFLERPLVFGMTPFRETGIGFRDFSEELSLTWAASAYAFPSDAWGDTFGNKGIGAAGRVTNTPINECGGNHLVHIAFDYAFSVPGPSGVTYRNGPEYNSPNSNYTSQSAQGGAGASGTGTGAGSGSSIPFIYNTGPLFFTMSNMVNGEFAGVYKQLHWQSEVTFNAIDFQGTTVVIPAYYVQVAYLLTGEVRPYDKKAAVLARINPLRPYGEGGLGAVELAFRYSFIDTNPVVPYSHAAPVAAQPGGPIIPWGGAVNDVTMGVNWYLNTYTKFQFNYIIANCDRGGKSSVVDVLGLRAQLDF